LALLYSIVYICDDVMMWYSYYISGRNSVFLFNNHVVAAHSLLIVYHKPAVEWCLYLVSGVIDIIWLCKCVCYT